MLKYLTILFVILFASGCQPLYNKNGMSIWGWSKSQNQAETHIGFISTDFFYQNSENGFQTTREKIALDKQLKDELGFGTVGIYYIKEF